MIRDTEADAFVVLLNHRNSSLDRFAALGADLVLCGHAHGGLIRLPLIGGLIGTGRELFPKYSGGIYTEGNTRMLVSRGIGNGTGVPRFLNNPEIPWSYSVQNNASQEQTLRHMMMLSTSWRTL